MCLTVGRQSRDLRPLSRDRSATFFKKISNCLKRPKNVVWQSADGRVTSDHCRVTVQRLFSKFSLIAWNVQKTLFDSRPTVAWPPTTVAWPFSDFFQNFPKLLETSKKRCLTVGRRSRDPATFFKIFPNCLKRPKIVVWQSADSRLTFASRPTAKNVVWQSADGRVTSVTVQRLFSKKFLIAWTTLSRDRSATFFKIFPNCLKRPKNVVWQSDLRPLSRDRRSRDLRPLSRDRSATFFKIFPNVVWQSADGRVTSDHCRASATFFKKISNCLKRPKNVVWQSADGRVTSTIVAWPFSDFFQNFPKSLETSKKRCLTVGRRSRDLRPLSRDRSATFFKIFPNCLKRLKNVVWQSAVGRVTSDHSRTASHTASQMYISFSYSYSYSYYY